MTYPFLVATSHRIDPHYGGMASWPPPLVDVAAVIAIDAEPFFVLDHWTTWDRTIVDDERPGWDGELRGSDDLSVFWEPDECRGCHGAVEFGETFCGECLAETKESDRSSSVAV